MGLDRLSGTVHYFTGAPQAGLTHMPAFRVVEYQGVYPGIDVLYHAHQEQLEYEFIIAPGGDPQTIRMDFRGINGLRIGAKDGLILEKSEYGAALRLSKPYAYQDIRGSRQEVASRYVIRRGQEVGFEIGPYETGQPLIIDSVLGYSTYWGGSGMDAFVSKLSPGGSWLLYSTYLGGSSGNLGFELGADIAMDPSGHVVVAGRTSSPSFPVTSGTVQPGSRGGVDAFVAKLVPAGSSLAYSTLIGGSNADYAYAIDLDARGNAYVTGSTQSDDFPIRNAVQESFGGGTCTDIIGLITFPCADTFVLALSSTGRSLRYSTFLGGSRRDVGNGIAVGRLRNVFVTGLTDSTDLPVRQPLQAVNRGLDDGFIARLNGCPVSLPVAASQSAALLDITLGIGTARQVEGTWVMAMLIWNSRRVHFFGVPLFSGVLPPIDPPFTFSFPLHVGSPPAIGVLSAYFAPSGRLCTYNLVWVPATEIRPATDAALDPMEDRSGKFTLEAFIEAARTGVLR